MLQLWRQVPSGCRMNTQHKLQAYPQQYLKPSIFKVDLKSEKIMYEIYINHF